MSTKLPNYIPVSLLESMPLEHSWDDWNPYQILGLPSEEVEMLLGELSDRAILTYIIGCAEWVVYRFNRFLNDRRPYLFLDACWAFEMSDWFAAPPESNESEWKGPVRAPVDLALMTILNGIYSLREHAVQVDGAFAELLPLHVIPKPGYFLEWHQAVLLRLKMLFPRTIKSNSFYVPREALDPAYQLSSDDVPRLVRSFLNSLDEANNPFLERIKPTTI